MPDPCFCSVDKFRKWEGQSRRGEFVLTPASLGCPSMATLWFFGSRRLCFARRLLPRSFVPLQRSHQLTHSLQNTLQFLCEGESVFRLSLLKGIAPSHPPYLFSKMWLLISCQCTLAYSLMACCCARLLKPAGDVKREDDMDVSKRGCKLCTKTRDQSFSEKQRTPLT